MEDGVLNEDRINSGLPSFKEDLLSSSDSRSIRSDNCSDSNSEARSSSSCDSGSEEIDECNPKKSKLHVALASWATSQNIHQGAVDQLLCILRKHGHEELPKTARTLLRTPKYTHMKNVAPGQYLHFGIEKNIINLISTQATEQIPEEIRLLVNIDGIPLTKSSSSQFWPILGRVNDTQISKPFVIGLFHGKTKPDDCNEYLEDFVGEAVRLTNNGIHTRSTIIPFRLSALICDAPARAFVTGIKGHTGYFGCGKCIQEGDYVHGRLCYPEGHASLRTDESFKNKTQEEHHNKTSILEQIPNFGMVSQTPYEYMHLVCLGVMKKLLVQWKTSKDHAVKLRAQKIVSAGDHLVSLNKYISREFARKTRSLKELDRYKATELRLILLYIGPLVFKQEI